MSDTVVPDIRTLKRMAKAGLITLHRDTGLKVRHWTGQTITAHYVDDVCQGVQQPFEFGGKHYRLKYFDGCFSPFVVCIENAGRHNVNLSETLIA